MDQMSSVKAKDGEGTVEATVETLDEWGRKQAIEKITGFYDTVCRHMKPN